MNGLIPPEEVEHAISIGEVSIEWAGKLIDDVKNR